MPDTITLDDAGFGSFLKKIDSLIDSLDRVDKSLKDTVKEGNALDRFFGSMSNFDTFISQIDRLKRDSVTDFKTIIDTLGDFGKALKDLPEEGLSQKLIGRVGFFFATIKELKTEDVARVTEALDKLKTGLAGMSGSNLEGADNFGRVVVKLGQGIRQLKVFVDGFKAIDGSELSDADFTEKLDSFSKKMTRTLNALISSFQKLDIVNSILPGLGTLENLSRVFDRLGFGFRQLSKVADELTLRETAKLTFQFGALSTLFKLIAASLKHLPGESQLDQLSSNFNRLGLGFRNLSFAASNIGLKDILRLGLIFGSLSGVFKLVASIVPKNDSLSELSTIFTRLANSFTELNNLAERINLGTAIKLRALGKIFNALGASFSNIASALAQSGRLGDLEKLSVVFKQIGEGMGSLINLSKTLPVLNIPAMIKQFLQMRKLMGTIEFISNSLSKIGANLNARGTLEAVTELSKIFDRLGRGFRSISNAGQNLSFKAAINLGKFLTGLGVSFRIVGALSGNLKNFRSFIDAFIPIVNALEKLGNLKIDFKNLNQFALTKPFQNFVKELKPIFNSLKGLSGKSLPDLNLILGPILDFIDRSETKEIRKDAFKNFKAIAKDIASGLKEFNKVKVDTKSINSLVSFFDKLSTIKDVKKLDLGQTKIDVSQSSINQTGTNVADALDKAVERGLLRSKIKEIIFSRVVNLAIDAFKTLNPVSLTIGVVKGVEIIINKIRDLVRTGIQSLKEAGSQLREFGDNLRQTGQNLISNFGIGALIDSAGFESAVGFDRLSSQLKTFGNLTEEQLETAQDFANQIGIDYPLSSNDALEALLNLSKAGLELQDTFEALPAAADLAAVSDTGDIDATSRLLIQVAGQFEQFTATAAGGFENANVAADIFARAANNSTASVESLSAGIENVGPIAGQFGLTLEETVAILALFEDAGVRGAEGGTQLKSMLTNLTRATPATRKAFAELGVSITDNEGNFKSLNQIINELNQSMNEVRTVSRYASNATGAQAEQIKAAEKAYAAAQRQLFLYQEGLNTSALDSEKAAKKIAQLNQVQANAVDVINDITGSQQTTELITSEITRTQQQNFRAIQNLAGTYGQAGLSILLAEGENAIAGFVDEMNGLPSAAESARQLLDNFSGDVEQLQGSVETLLTKAFLPLLNRAFRPLVQLGRKVADFFLSLPDPILETVSSAVLLASTLATITGAILIGTGIVLQFGGAILGVAGFVLTLVSNSALLIGAVAGIATTFAALIATVTIVSGILLSISAAFTALATIIEDDIGGAGQQFDRFKRSLNGVFERIGDIVAIVGSIGGSLFGVLFDESSASAGERIAGILDNISDKIQGFKRQLDQALFVLDAFNQFLNLPEKAATASQQTAALLGASVQESTEILNSAMDQRFTELLDRAADIKLVKRILGDDATGQDLLNFFQSVRETLIKIKNAAGDVLGGLVGSIFGDENAEAQLESGLNRLLSMLTNVLQNVTGLDLSGAILNFDSGNLDAGLQTFVSTILNKIRDLIFANEGLITNALGAIFRYIIPGKFLSPLARFLGLDTIADTIDGVINDVVDVFKGLVGTLFDVFKGQSLEDALLANFGDSAKPAIRLVESIGRALGTLVGIITDLITVAFPGGMGTGGNFFEILFDGAASAFEILNTTVLVPLRAALPQIISGLARVFTFVTNTISNFLSFIGTATEPIRNLFSALLGGDISFTEFTQNIIPTLVATVQNVINGLPELIGSGLSNIGQLIGNDVLVKIGDEIAAGDFTGAIDIIAGHVSTFIKDALAKVPDLLINIGESIGSPLLIKVGEAIESADASAAIESIKTAIKDTIIAAIEAVPGALTDIGATLGIDALIDLGESIDTTSLQQIADIIGTIVTYPLETLSSIISAVGDLVNFFKTADSETLTKFTTAVGGFGAAIVLLVPGTLTAIAGAAGTLIGTLAGAASAALPVIAIAGALVILTSALNNLDLLLKGDVAGFLEETLVDIAQTLEDVGFGQIVSKIGDIFGVEIDPSQLAESVRQGFDVVVDIIRNAGLLIDLAIRNIQAKLEIGQRNIADAAKNSADDARARVEEAIGGSDFSRQFFGNAEALANQTGLELFTITGENIKNAVDIESVRAQFGVNYNKILDEFRGLIPSLQGLSDTDFANLANTIINADALGDALANVAANNPDMLGPFVERLTTLTPEELANINTDDLLKQIETFIGAGLLDKSVAVDIVTELQAKGVITESQKGRFFTQVNGLFETLAGQFNEPVEAPVTIEPEVEIADTTAGADANVVDVPITANPVIQDFEPISAEEAAAIVRDQPAIPLEQPVDVQPVTSPETAIAFAESLAAVQTNSDAAQASLTEFQNQSSEIGVAIEELLPKLANYALSTTINTSIATGLWFTHSSFVITQTGIMKSNIDAINTAFVLLNTQLIIFTPIINANIDLMKVKFVEFGAGAAPAIDNVTDSIVSMIGKIDEAILKLKALIKLIRERDTLTGQNSDAGFAVNGRAEGGPVFAGRLYEVAERGISELLRMGNRTFLIPGQNGTVIPPSPIASQGVPSISNNRTSNSNLVINEGDIFVEVSAGSGANANEIATVTANAVATQRNDIRRRLVNGGRTGV